VAEPQVGRQHRVDEAPVHVERVRVEAVRLEVRIVAGVVDEDVDAEAVRDFFQRHVPTPFVFAEIAANARDVRSERCHCLL
jgi:hypothetical protein